MRLYVLLVALVAAAPGCGGDTTQSTTSDLAMSSAVDMTKGSVCGKPGDTGNSLGVGKYCTTSPDCAGNSMAKVCSTLMPPPQGPAYFCTMACDINATTNPCGENATCTCLQPGACGCVPDTCRVGLFG